MIKYIFNETLKDLTKTHFLAKWRTSLQVGLETVTFIRFVGSVRLGTFILKRLFTHLIGNAGEIESDAFLV